jgi:hypothetical protein
VIYRFAGLAVPYDRVARKNLRRIRFAPRSIPAATVRLLRDHDNALRLGTCEIIPDPAAGMLLTGWTRHPVQTGQGLSIGIEVVEIARGRVLAAVAEEVSIVSSPAFPECVITEVHEEERPWPTLAGTS